MEVHASAPSGAFTRVKEDLESAIQMLAEHEKKNDDKLKEYEQKIEELNERLVNTKRKEKRKIELLKEEVERRGKLIEDNKKKSNLPADSENKELRLQLEDKIKMVNFLRKRVKIFDEALEKCKQEHENTMKGEKVTQQALRKKLKKLKKLSDGGKKNQEITSTEVVELKQKINVCEETIKTIKEEKLTWEKEKAKCKDDVEYLLADYSEKQKVFEACEQKLLRKVEKQKERMRSMEETLVEQEKENQFLKVKFEEVEAKLRANFEDKRGKYIAVVLRVKQLEAENKKAKEDLERSNNKYENLLLLESREVIFEQNEALIARIEDIEMWFDEAWAGFRLEVLSYERKLEQKDDLIEGLKAEKEGRVFVRVKPRFEETGSGISCLKAMQEINTKFKFSERSKEYLNAVKNLKFESSTQQILFEKDLVQIKQIQQVHDEDVEKMKSSEVISTKSEDDSEKNAMDKKTSENGALLQESVEQAINKQVTGNTMRQDLDEQYDFEDEEEEGSVKTESCGSEDKSKSSVKEEKIIENEGVKQIESAALSTNNKWATEKEYNSNNSGIKTTQSQRKTFEIETSDAGNTNKKKGDSAKNKLVEQVQVEHIHKKDDIHLQVQVENNKEKITVEEYSTKENIIDGGKENNVKNNRNNDGRVYNFKKGTTLSILKKADSNSSLKSVSFNNIVDGQYFDENSTSFVGSEEFVAALKAPQKEKWQIPKVSILDIPRPLKKINGRVFTSLPKFKAPYSRIVSQPKLQDDEEEQITAADIFGPTKKTVIEEEDEDEDLFDTGNLDDAMDFLLNM